MHDIHLIFIDKEDADKANELLCKFFQGSELFIDNHIVVTPVKPEYQVVDKGIVDRWAFNVCFFNDISDVNEETIKQIVVSAGELNIMNRKTVWALDILYPANYITK